MFKRILLCYDGSAASYKALKRGAELAMLINADVHVLSIVPAALSSATVYADAAGTVCLVDAASEGRRSLEEAIARLTAMGIKAQGHAAQGTTIDAIVTFANRLASDLIVVGHYPKVSRERWWSGPERASLAERVACCVFIAVSD